MNAVFDNIVVKAYRKWNEQRFLKKHGCETWQEYNRKYDPDYNTRASKIKDVYYGYPYVHCFENRNHCIYDWDIHIDGTYIITKWCEENLKNKFRFDFQRVFRASSTDNEWELNEIGGGDYIFVAFKDQKDYTYFLLKWA